MTSFIPLLFSSLETSFTYIALVLAEVYERQRKYLLANLIYELLLILPYIQHRRGRWYKRLCINYDHLKMTNGLLSSIVRGILDINIMVSAFFSPAPLPMNNFYLVLR